MKILITGDSGFIGSHLTHHLIQHGHTVFGIDIESRKKYTVEYRFCTGDILDTKALAGIPEGIDCIIHLAAAHKDFGIARDEYYTVNVEGMRTLLRFADERSITKFIFYSSVAVYGDSQPSTESTEPHPVNHYGGSKLEAEGLLKEWSATDANKSAVIIRPAVVFGPRNVANIFKLIRQVCDGKFIWVGKGHNVKSIAYVENLIEATRFLMDRMMPGCEVFNYSDEPHMETRELVSMISRLADTKVPSFHIPLWSAVAVVKVIDIIGAVIHHDFSITAARLLKFNASTKHESSRIRGLGFLPPFSLEEGLRKNIQWYRSDAGRSEFEQGVDGE